MKHLLLSCLFSSLLVVPASYAQTQTTARSAMKLLLSGDQPQHSYRASADKVHRGITANVTVPGRSTGRSWNGTTNRWDTNGSVSAYSYDSRGNNTQRVDSDSATSTIGGRQLIMYNTRNQETEYLQQNWNGSAYVNEQREQYTYDAQGNITLELYQEWSNNAWVTQDSYRTTNTYNAANVLVGQVYEELNNNNTWEIEGRIIFTVNASNQWSEAVYQEWINGVYVNDERTRNITWYDWNNRLLSYFEDQEWSGGAWVDDQRSTIVYQPNGSNVETQQQPTASNTWVNDDRITTTYDNFGNLILDQNESWDNNAWVITGADRVLLSYTATNQVRRAVEQNYDISLGRYVNSYLTTYGNFVTLGTRRATSLEAVASLYPNPSSSVTLLYVPGVSNQGAIPAEVLNTVGQVVRTFVLHPQQGSIRQELNLEGLAGGIYTVRLHPMEGTIAKRIVKQ